MQGYLGSIGFEQLQLVWAQPVGAAANSTDAPGLGQPHVPLIVAPDGDQQSRHSSHGGAPIGPIAGGVAGGLGVLLALLAWGAFSLRRRRRGQAGMAGPALHKEAAADAEVGPAPLSTEASVEPSAAGLGLGEALCLQAAVGASWL